MGTDSLSLPVRRSEKFEDKTRLNPAPADGTGAIISDISDLRTYAKERYTGSLLKLGTQAARLETQPLEMQHSVEVTYGFGYGEGIMKWGKFWGHKGDLFGFSSVMFYLPEKDATIVINVNRLDKDFVKNSADDLVTYSGRPLNP